MKILFTLIYASGVTNSDNSNTISVLLMFGMFVLMAFLVYTMIKGNKGGEKTTTTTPNTPEKSKSSWIRDTSKKKEKSYDEDQPPRRGSSIPTVTLYSSDGNKLETKTLHRGVDFFIGHESTNGINTARYENDPYEEWISLNHLGVNCDDEGWFVCDYGRKGEGSSNGTYTVNGKKFCNSILDISNGTRLFLGDEKGMSVVFNGLYEEDNSDEDYPSRLLDRSKSTPRYTTKKKSASKKSSLPTTKVYRGSNTQSNIPDTKIYRRK